MGHVPRSVARCDEHLCTRTVLKSNKPPYLSKLVSGEWTGTMCLTESHCGTDLGMLRTKAEPQADGSKAILVIKIFISAGEHDLVDNIVHIVIARGRWRSRRHYKGISPFIVPKFLPNAEGGVGERNAVPAVLIEHKMGIHGNATCVINFDGAKHFDWPRKQRSELHVHLYEHSHVSVLHCKVWLHSEVAFQGGIEYARDRLQMRSLTGPKAPEKPLTQSSCTQMYAACC